MSTPSNDILITNRALGQVGAEGIASFADNTKQGRLTAVLYPQCRDAVLRMHPWNCATQRAILAAPSATPVFGYANSYTIPTGCLRLLSAWDADGTYWSWRSHECCGARLTIEGQQILTDAGPPLNVRFVQEVDPGLYDALLIETMVAYLTAQLAVPMANDKSLMQAWMTTFEKTLSRARSISVLEDGDHTRRGFEILAARR